MKGWANVCLEIKITRENGDKSKPAINTAICSESQEYYSVILKWYHLKRSVNRVSHGQVRFKCRYGVRGSERELEGDGQLVSTANPIMTVTA